MSYSRLWSKSRRRKEEGGRRTKEVICVTYLASENDQLQKVTDACHLYHIDKDTALHCAALHSDSLEIRVMLAFSI